MSKPRILVIEDDEAIRRLIETSLKASGHDVHTAVDGVAGLEAATAIVPAVILLDVTMPRMDGWEVLAKLREKDAFAFTPVILLTALASPDHRVAGFRLGADDYMTKPFRPAELELRVARALRHRAQLVYFSKGLDRARAADKSSAMRGSLHEFRAAAVLSMLYDEHKTGAVTFASDSMRARVVIRDGLIVSVAFDGELAPSVTATEELAALTNGTFEFEPFESVEGPPGDPATAELLASMRPPIDAEALESIPPPK